MVRRSGLVLLLLAVLAGVAVPRGWMPRASAAGVTITLCSAGLHGQAREQALAAANSLLAAALDDDGADDADGKTCPHAALPSAALLPSPPVALSDASFPDMGVPPLPRSVMIGRGLAAPPPPATGPPPHH
ncbi:hypothetical protein V5740_09030 [Croceibacterium sp. TMG7-5b_MA50]|uniref:hypothetical protein n=1 Tax=Croceibacterium sp. TMG7-5b_MA50 TaxID=3121290 RepID=UPI003222114A